MQNASRHCPLPHLDAYHISFPFCYASICIHKSLIVNGVLDGLTSNHKRLVQLILALLVLSCPVLAATEQMPVSKTYGGIIDISAPLTDEPPPLNDEKFEPLLVIRTQHEYEGLLRRIPTEGISQGSPAPKNDAPLLHKPQIDFTKQMLVVVVRASMDAPEIRSVVRKDGKIVIRTEFSDNSLPRPYGTGTYSAVLIALSTAKVVVEATERAKEKHEEPQP